MKRTNEMPKISPPFIFRFIMDAAINKIKPIIIPTMLNRVSKMPISISPLNVRYK